MTYAGARGKTEAELASVLHFTLGQQHLHSVFGELTSDLRSIPSLANITLNIANSLWPQGDSPLMERFLALVAEDYQASVVPVDYAAAPDSVRTKINRWVSTETQERIPALIPPGGIDPSTSLLLVSAIYFMGRWAETFDVNDTTQEPFHISPDAVVRVPMMRQSHEFNYFANDFLQMLELPYNNGHLSMLVLLPLSYDGLPQLEADLNWNSLQGWIVRSRRREVSTRIPRFTMSSSLDVSHVLASMGIADAFSRRGADFSGMTGSRDLFVSSIQHGAFIDVNEQGTEAACASAVFTSYGFVQRATFHADHPFVFLIQDNWTRSILFIGRVLDPSVT